MIHLQYHAPSCWIVEIHEFNLSFSLRLLQDNIVSENVQDLLCVVSKNHFVYICVLEQRQSNNSSAAAKLNNNLSFEFGEVFQGVMSGHDDARLPHTQTFLICLVEWLLF